MPGVESIDHAARARGPKQLIFVGTFLESNFKNSGNVNVTAPECSDEIAVATVFVEKKRESLQAPLGGFFSEFRAKAIVVGLLVSEKFVNFLGIRVVIRQRRVNLPDRKM